MRKSPASLGVSFCSIMCFSTLYISKNDSLIVPTRGSSVFIPFSNKYINRAFRQTFIECLPPVQYKEVTIIPEKLPLTELEKPIEQHLEQTLEMRASLQDKLNYLAEYKQSVEQNNKVVFDIEILKKKKQEIDTEIKDYQKKIIPIKQFIKKVGELLGNSAMDFLNTPQSAIQKYYRYLNPLPTSKPVQFEGSDLNLKIMVATSSEGNGSISNAQHTLSSGQLNVLAMAIFLAINDSQKVSRLEFVAIDDPIQNMDDVNQFSICDVLGGLRKQLIFSTHDINFVKLFVKKNEHQKEDIQLYILESPHLTNSKVRKVAFN